jgi:hypothetical protein
MIGYMEIVQYQRRVGSARPKEEVTAGIRATNRHSGIPVDRLEVIVEGLASTADIRDLDITRHDGRDYRRLLSTDLLDAWLIAWGPSSFLGLHDHGGSSGAIAVVRGSLVEISTDLASRPALRTAHLTTGSVKSFGGLQVHEVWNPNIAVAVSAHVYSPPLSAMSFYDESAAPDLTPLRTTLAPRDVPPDL